MATTQELQQLVGKLMLDPAFRWTFAALLVFVIAIPWPFLKYGRPLLRAIF